MSGWRDHLYLRYDFPGVVPRLNHVCYAVLSECFSFVSCLSCVPLGMSCVRFYPNVLRSFCACHAFLSKCLAFDHACCLPPVRQTGRLAGCSVPIPPWVGIAGSAFSNRRYGYRALWVHFGLARFFMAIPTENEGTRGTGSAARCGCVLRKHIGFVMLSAGSTLGLRAPILRQRAIGSLDSPHLIRSVGAL